MFANMLGKLWRGILQEWVVFAHAFNGSYVVFLHDMYTRAEDYTG